MTPQEATEELKEEFEIFKNGIDPKHWENPNKELRKIIEANTMAIEVLGREPCDDAISRQAVLMEIDKYLCGVPYEKGIDEVIKDLPPVTPKPNTNVLDKIRAEIKEWYWQADKQALTKDPCAVDAMIDLFIRTIKKYEEESEVEHAEALRSPEESSSADA